MRGKKLYSQKVLSVLCALFCPVLAHAAHPLITDDAGTAGAGNSQLELNGEYARFDEEGVTAKVTEVAAGLTYGIAETMDVVLGMPYGDIDISGGGEDESHQGIGDVSLAAKWRFFERDGCSLALKPGITLPTGDENEGLGTGRPTYSVFAILSKELEPFVVHMNVGYMRNENDFDDREDLWHVSLATEYAACESLRLVVNIGQERNTDKGSDVNPAFILGGAIYSITEAFDADLGLKAGLNDAEADYAVLAGVTLWF